MRIIEVGGGNATKKRESNGDQDLRRHGEVSDNAIEPIGNAALLILGREAYVEAMCLAIDSVVETPKTQGIASFAR